MNCVDKYSLDKLLINALVCSMRIEHSHIFVSRISDEGLYKAFCELQPTVNDNPHAKDKCALIIDKVDDQDILKDMILTTKNYALINEAISKITSYGKLKIIAESRPELSVHVKGRLGMMPNSTKFILDD